jgi:hypothetical protein
VTDSKALAAGVLRTAMLPALAILGPVYDSTPARVLWLAISGQEASWKDRRQQGNGPARGLWQFERPGGVHGVLTHPASHSAAVRLCAACDVDPTDTDVYNGLERDDVLAAGMARLLLWTDRHALPAAGDQLNAWLYYVRNWQPGKPRPDDWAANYQTALALVQEKACSPS